MIVAILLSIELVKTFHMRVDLIKKDFWKVAVLHLRLRNCTEAEEIVDLVGRTWRILGWALKVNKPVKYLKKRRLSLSVWKTKKMYRLASIFPHVLLHTEGNTTICSRQTLCATLLASTLLFAYLHVVRVSLRISFIFTSVLISLIIDLINDVKRTSKRRRILNF